jgi:hypothetical protein
VKAAADPIHPDEDLLCEARGLARDRRFRLVKNMLEVLRDGSREGAEWKLRREEIRPVPKALVNEAAHKRQGPSKW